MKARLLALIAIAFFSQTAIAQSSLGVKLGANLSKIQGQPFSSGFNAGYLAGGFAIIPLGGKFSVQPEVLFNQSKTKTDTSVLQVSSDAYSSFKNGDIKLDYLSIPLLLNYKLIGNVLSLQAGPQFGVLINKDNNLFKNGQNAFKTGDFSMVGGVQVKITKLYLSGRYVVGLNNINDIGNSNQWKNQAWQLSVGLGIL
ncbi:MAG: PorT family protein [Chitinophagaceae bacterium]